MAELTYRHMPSVQQFKKDSSVALAVRDKDIILTHIDRKLQAYASAVASNEQNTADLLAMELFQSCNFWIASFNRRNPLMLKGRYPAVLALFEAVVNELATAFGLEKTKDGVDLYMAPKVASLMRDMFGFALHSHGVTLDVKESRAATLDEAQRATYRVYFKHGLAYQRPWWTTGPDRLKLRLADSQHAAVPEGLRNANLPGAQASPGYGTFVMTQDRNLYMAIHSLGESGTFAGIFHSSYSGGSRVIAAGSMKIQNGRVLGYRADSGHYQPTEHSLRFLLQALMMYGVDCGRVELLNHLGEPYYLSSTGSIRRDARPGDQAPGGHRRLMATDVLSPNSMLQLKEILDLNRFRAPIRTAAVKQKAV